MLQSHCSNNTNITIWLLKHRMRVREKFLCGLRLPATTLGGIESEEVWTISNPDVTCFGLWSCEQSWTFEVQGRCTTFSQVPNFYAGPLRCCELTSYCSCDNCGQRWLQEEIRAHPKSTARSIQLIFSYCSPQWYQRVILLAANLNQPNPWVETVSLFYLSLCRSNHFK